MDIALRQTARDRICGGLDFRCLSEYTYYFPAPPRCFDKYPTLSLTHFFLLLKSPPFNESPPVRTAEYSSLIVVWVAGAPAVWVGCCAAARPRGGVRDYGWGWGGVDSVLLGDPPREIPGTRLYCSTLLPTCCCAARGVQDNYPFLHTHFLEKTGSQE